MADERELTYKIGADTSDAQGNLDKLESSVEQLDESTARVQVGAQNVSGALSDMGAAGAGAAREVSGAVNDMGSGFDDASDEARAAIKKIGAEASSFSAAFKKTMAAGIKDGQSLAKSFQTGVGGALSFTEKKFTGFKNNVQKGVKSIGTAFTHPVQAIKGKFVKALDEAEEAEEDVGEKARDAERDVKGLGETGASSGNQISQAMSKAVKAFIGFKAIKGAVTELKNFIGSALEAAKATENTAAKFDRLFAGSDAEEWAGNFSKAVNRSATEVKSFLVQNKAMYTDLGITGDAANQLSEITTSLAYDFGNAFKMDDAEALSVLQDAIKGNSAALTEYGFDLSDAAIKAQALKVGLSDDLDALDDATLAQLRMNTILDQSADVQQAAIGQTEGLVNSTKSLKGIWSNFMEQAGAKFTPVIEKFFNTIIKAWPKIEPALMGLVDILSEGLSQVMPVVAELATSLLPVLADIIGVVFDAVTPILPVFTSLAQNILPPLAAIFGELARTILPPLTDIFMVLVDDVILPLLPIVQQLISVLLPPFVELLSMISPILQMVSPLLSMLAQLLVPIASVIGELISAILPPLMTILDTIFTSILMPLMPIITSLVEALLPPIASLLGIIAPILELVSPILQAISPVLEVIGTVLKVIADVLGKVIGWVADGIGKVVGFFSSLFGGAKESKQEVEGLSGAVNGLDDATSKETSLAVDTSSYTNDITSASAEANAAAQENIVATKDISDLNLQLMGVEVSSTYSTMSTDAETAWSRMTAAAETGAAKIVEAFQKISAAAQSIGNVSITASVSGVPGHASGTDDFEGGWTKINERGGELAFLPSGSAIVPADKSDRILSSSTDNSSTSTGDFSPNITISIQGNADSSTVSELESRLPDILKRAWEDFKADDLQMMTLKNAYTG